MYGRRRAPIRSVAALSAAILAAWAPAQASEALARQKACLNCHALDRKLVGPALKDVARRYAGQKDVVPRLAEKVVKGGAGAWGPVAMTANPRVTPEEAKRLVEWVLTLQ